MEQQTKKQTAVEWLIEQYEKGIQYNPLEKDGYSNARNKLIEEAKEMENQQLKEKYDNGYANGQMDLIIN